MVRIAITLILLIPSAPPAALSVRVAMGLPRLSACRARLVISSVDLPAFLLARTTPPSRTPSITLAQHALLPVKRALLPMAPPALPALSGFCHKCSALSSVMKHPILCSLQPSTFALSAPHNAIPASLPPVVNPAPLLISCSAVLASTQKTALMDTTMTLSICNATSVLVLVINAPTAFLALLASLTTISTIPPVSLPALQGHY